MRRVGTGGVPGAYVQPPGATWSHLDGATALPQTRTVRPDCAINGPDEADLQDAVELLERQLNVERPTIRDLANAVRSARVIGEAFAIIRAGEHCSSEQAFLMLAHESQHDHLAIRDIAEWVVLTGRY